MAIESVEILQNAQQYIYMAICTPAVEKMNTYDGIWLIFVSGVIIINYLKWGFKSGTKIF